MKAVNACSEINHELKDRKILLVDDDRLNLRILVGILQPYGVRVETAASGEAAIEQYDRFHPDLVLLDVIMPGINGFETCLRLKQAHGLACAPVIFITAKHASEDIVEGLAAGGVDYLSKPFQPAEALARIRIHLQNRRLLQEQARLVEQLSQANAAKNRFLGMAAHDLRNPLASIRALAEFLGDGTVGALMPEQLDLVTSIRDASQSMFSLVNELLDLAVIESGVQKLDLHPTSLGGLLATCVNLATLSAAKKGTVFQLTPAPGPENILIDADKIQQVVNNLLSNAVKFSPPNSTVTVGLYRREGWVHVWVRDQGPGIPEDERSKLFQDFGRTSVQPTAGEKSIGLGLAICKKLILAHQGTICADNETDGGCTFRFSLPLAP